MLESSSFQEEWVVPFSSHSVGGKKKRSSRTLYRNPERDDIKYFSEKERRRGDDA